MPIVGGPILERPQAIIFDIGRVIIPVDLGRSFCRTRQHDGLSAEQVWRALQTDARWDDWQEGRMAPPDWHKTSLRKKFHLSFGFTEFCESWNRVLDPATLLPDELFERLAANCRLALLFKHRSHPRCAHRSHLRPSYATFRCVFIPAESGPASLVPSFTITRLRELAALPDETLYVDDLREMSMPPSAWA